MSDHKVYTASPTLQRFHASNASMRFIRGPVGSGKTIGTIMEAMRRGSQIQPYSDGVRRTRCVAVRNTLSQLKSTFLVSWMEWLRPVSRYKVSDQTIEVRYALGDGTRVEMDVFLLPLDTPENQQRLLSLELTFGIASEFRELDLEIIQAVMSRCGRYPSRANLDTYWYGLWGETNSFSIDSPWFEFLEASRPPGVDYFVQPGARSPGAENLAYLPPAYYSNLIENNSDAWVRSYIDNELTPSLSGQAVFAASFDHTYHVSPHPLRPIPGTHLVIGLDVGRNPAATIGQIDPRGRLLVLHALYGENIGIDKFLAETLKPLIHQRFAGMPLFAVLDPSARNKSQVSEISVLDAVKQAGLVALLAPTNDIAPRLSAVERYLNRRDGVLFCPEHAHSLIHAMQYGYRYRRRKGDKQLEEIPEKRHPDSDLADSFQYLCLGVDSQVMARAVERQRQRTAPPLPPPSAAGWT